jgi:hypothetical protein
MLLDMLGLLARWFLLSAKISLFYPLNLYLLFFFLFFFLSFFGRVCSYRILEIINQFLKLEQKNGNFRYFAFCQNDQAQEDLYLLIF